MHAQRLPTFWQLQEAAVHTLYSTDRGAMATMEVLRTRLDTLQWETNWLLAENRRLREEHPEESRVLALEAESKNEVATLRDRISECEQEMETVRAEAATVQREKDRIRES